MEGGALDRECHQAPFTCQSETEINVSVLMALTHYWELGRYSLKNSAVQDWPGLTEGSIVVRAGDRNGLDNLGKRVLKVHSSNTFPWLGAKSVLTRSGL